jgi:plastocyanin
MLVSRQIAAIVLVATVATACTSKGGSSKTVHSSGPSGTSTTSGAPCAEASAKAARQTLITAVGFSPSCVKIKAGAQFFFVNKEKKHHSATTRTGSPTSFDADMRSTNSTYTQVFKKKGTYVVEDKTTKKTMTLFVT